MKVILICGLFFQDGTYSFWSGVLNVEPNGEIVGTLTDVYGESTVSDGRMEGNRLSFVKRYSHRRDRIRYEFERSPDGSQWVGHYTGSATAVGGARCVTNEVSEEFFQPPAANGADRN